MSKLIGGNIPKGKPCPWEEKCVIKCSRKNKESLVVEFSCACARGFDMVESKDTPKDKKTTEVVRKIMENATERSWKE